MSERPDHAHEPDPAALDELVRAFADDATPDRPGAGRRDDRTGASPDELFIVEQSPVVDEWDQHLEGADELDELDDVDELAAHGRRPVGADSDESPAMPESTEHPALIRIDDDAGSTTVADDAGTDDTATAAVDTATDDGTDGRAGDDGSPAGDRIVIEIDDDLPDAVYVEGSLVGDASRSIVLIEDDDTGDTLKPESERDLRRGIEPRMRERRAAVKRAKGRQRLISLGIAFLVVMIVVAGLAVLGSSWFAIRADQVTVTGNVYTDPARLEAVIDDLVGTPALLADTQRAERDLEAIPWVEEAKVRVDFPHAASIEIRERQAISTYQGPDQRFRVLDREGRVLDVLDGYPFAYLLLSGPDPVDLEPGEFAPRGYAAASELAKNLTGSLRQPGRIEMIEVTADGSSLVMRLDDGTEVRFGEARDLFAKLVRLETVLTSSDDLEPGVIDVSTREVTR